MHKNNKNTAAIRRVKSFRADRPRSDATSRKSAQATAFVKDVKKTFEAPAEETTKVLEQSSSTVDSQLIEMIRAITNATFDSLHFAHQLLGVKSAGELIQLSSAYAGKQIGAIAEQSRNLRSWGQMVMMHRVEPLQRVMSKTA
jgi:hypothetical protein